MTKIFCIGFHKTGTSSLGSALLELGFRVTGPNLVRDQKIREDPWALVKHLVPEYDAFKDNPWPVLYRQIHSEWPDARFILTWREPGDWIQSVERFFGTASTPMRELIYGAGSPAGHRHRYLQRYRAHYDAVRAYFGENSGQLLDMNVFDGDGWEKLCAFLGTPRPSVAFPHVRPAAASPPDRT